MEARHRPKILIADDHTLVAEACAQLLKQEFEVLNIVSDGRTLLLLAAELQPDVVIIDISMPQLNGLDAGEQIKAKNRHCKLIYLTMHTKPEIAAEAFRRGASGYVIKQSSSGELVNAVRRVLRGERYLSTMIPKDTVDFLLRSGTESKQITVRQREVLQLLAEGKTMKEVACMLQIETGTVAFHKYKMMEVLGLKSNAELLQYAIKHCRFGAE